MKQGYAIQTAIGISCTAGGQELRYTTCRIRLHKAQIELVENKNFADTEELLHYLKQYKELPIALHLQGKSVLVKEVPGEGAMTSERIRSVFPNYKEEEYLFSDFFGMPQTYLALAKKDRVEQLLSDFRCQGLSVVRVFLGPFVAENILPQLNGYSGQYAFDGHYISRNMEADKWTAYRYDPLTDSKFQPKIQGMDIAPNGLMAYAAAFSLLMHRFVEEIHVPYASIDSEWDDFLQKLRFRTNAAIVLAVFFVLLLLNALVYTRYFNAYEGLEYRTNENFSSAQEMQQLATTVAKNDSLLIRLGWNGGVPKSWLLDQLAASLGQQSGLSWQSVDINPLQTKRIGTKVEETDQRFAVQISGSCQTLNELEGWVRSLGQLPWVEQVAISKFMDSNKPKMVGKEFLLSVHYSYDF